MEYMSLLHQLCDGNTFDVFTAGQNMSWKVIIKGGVGVGEMKIAVCQIQAIWRMVRSFHTKILDQVSRLSCRGQGGVIMEENHSIPNKTWSYSVTDLSHAF